MTRRASTSTMVPSLTPNAGPAELPAMPEADLARRFAGVARLHGVAALQRFAAAHVVVVGIGGVGSWAAEALARSAVGRLTLIDLDHIAESNTNRQIHALESTYGQAKVQAMALRIAAINPACAVGVVEDFVTPDNVAQRVPAADAVIDCIDQVDAKAALLAWCVRQGIAVVSCGAGGGRIDPTRIRSADLARASGDPLLAKLRHRLRREHGFPREGSSGRVHKFGVMAVFSDEPVQLPRRDDPTVPGTATTQGLACSGYGSSVTVTAPLGFAAAALVLQRLAGTPPAHPALD
jgi:tRNA threonylcarbamoyladenosine dehydratase